MPQHIVCQDLVGDWEAVLADFFERYWARDESSGFAEAEVFGNLTFNSLVWVGVSCSSSAPACV
jgi:hypothetical protein